MAVYKRQHTQGTAVSRFYWGSNRNLVIGVGRVAAARQARSGYADRKTRTAERADR